MVVKTVTVDGVDFEIVDEKQYNEMKSRNAGDIFLQVNNYAYAYITPVRWSDIFKLLDLDWNSVDGAFPVDPKYPNKEIDFENRIKNGDVPFWYYGDEPGCLSDKIFGRPLWRSHIYFRLTMLLECEMMRQWFADGGED